MSTTTSSSGQIVSPIKSTHSHSQSTATRPSRRLVVFDCCYLELLPDLQATLKSFNDPSLELVCLHCSLDVEAVLDGSECPFKGAERGRLGFAGVLTRAVPSDYDEVHLFTLSRSPIHPEYFNTLPKLKKLIVWSAPSRLSGFRRERWWVPERMVARDVILAPAYAAGKGFTGPDRHVSMPRRLYERVRRPLTLV